MNVLELIEREEGYRAKVYRCSEGYPTIGIGTKIGPKNAPLEMYQFEVSRNVARAFLSEKVYEDIGPKLNGLTWFAKLDSKRQQIIISMAYQMGVSGVLKFKKMIHALEQGDFTVAAYEALNSRWAKQTPERANRHAESLRTGVIV